MTFAVRTDGDRIRVVPADAVAVRQSRATVADSWRRITGAGARAVSSAQPTIWLDGRRHPTLDKSVPQIGAPAAWAVGVTGTGVTVAILGTGVDHSHPDLAGS